MWFLVSKYREWIRVTYELSPDCDVWVPLLLNNARNGMNTRLEWCHDVHCPPHHPVKSGMSNVHNYSSYDNVWLKSGRNNKYSHTIFHPLKNQCMGGLYQMMLNVENSRNSVHCSPISLWSLLEAADVSLGSTPFLWLIKPRIVYKEQKSDLSQRVSTV